MTSSPSHYQYASYSLEADFPLPELAECKAPGQPDFRLTLSVAPPSGAIVTWAHDFPDAFGESTLRCERTTTGYRLHFPGIATVLASAGGEIGIHPHVGAAMDFVRHVLLDQALPRILAQRGELVLHGAVVGTRSGKSLLLIGDSGRGKSTLTGAFFASGRTVGTDDGALVRVTDGALCAFPTYPSLRLLPDSRGHLFAGVESSNLPIAGYSEKRRLPVPGAMGASRVDAIVLLAPPLEDHTPPRLSRETPGLACMAMIRHGFQLDLSDTSNLKALLAKAAEAAVLVPVYQLHYPRRYEVLPDVIDLLERET